MRFFLMICFVLIISQPDIRAQTGPVLARKISIRAENESLRNVLSKIEALGKFHFSYNSDLLSADSLISVSFNYTPLYEVLDRLFNNNIDYHELEGFVVLRPAIYRLVIEADAIEAQGRHYRIEGKILDAKTGNGIKNASVYERRLLKSTLTDKNGIFKIQFKGDHRSVMLTASKALYKDTTMFFLSDVKILPEGLGGNSNRQSGNTGTGFHNAVEQSGFGRFFVSSKRRMQSLNISEFFVNSKVQASILPGVGSQGLMSSQIVNSFSFNVLGGYSAGVRGFESAGVFNLTKKNIEGGFQLAGIFNQVGGHVEGTQLSGILNLVHGRFDGFQMGGLFNLVEDGFNGVQVSGIYNQIYKNFNGLQFAGLFNAVSGKLSGLQISGIANITRSNFKGLQFAGVFNEIRGDTAKGIQLGGIVNLSKNFKGLQFGLINIADSTSGVGIGLINIYKNGYLKLGVYTNELLSQQFSFKSGSKRLYSILEVGSNWRRGESRVYNFGFGLGHDLYCTKDLSIGAELQNTSFCNKGWKVLGNSTKLTLGTEHRLSKQIGLMAGINYQLYSQDIADEETKPYPSWVNHFNATQKGWIGGRLGLVYNL